MNQNRHGLIGMETADANLKRRKRLVKLTEQSSDDKIYHSASGEDIQNEKEINRQQNNSQQQISYEKPVSSQENIEIQQNALESSFRYDGNEIPECQDRRFKGNIKKREWFDSNIYRLLLEYFRVQSFEENDLTKEEKDCFKVDFYKLRNYGLSSDFSYSTCIVRYQCSPKHAKNNVGRLYGYTESLHTAKDPIRYLGLQTMKKWVRGALAQPFYWDLDVINAHPSLLVGILFELGKSD